MKQYIKKSAVVEEIERRQDYYKRNPLLINAEYCIEEDSAILKFLDTLEVKEVKEEPVSEDLVEAARSYSNNLDNIYGSIGEQTKNAFKAGAEWQEGHLIGKMEKFLYEELGNGDIECSDMKFLIKYFKFYMKEGKE